MSKAWAKGSTRSHRRARAVVLERNRRRHKGKCEVGVPGVCTGHATQAHHVQGKGVTGDDPRFMIGSCPECNRHVGDPQQSSPPPKIISDWS